MSKSIQGNLRYVLLDSVGGKCQSCDTNLLDTIFHIHHIDSGGGNDEGNLMVLCVKCHRKIHAEIRQEAKARRIARWKEEGYVRYHGMFDLTREQIWELKAQAYKEQMSVKEFLSEIVLRRLENEKIGDNNR